MRNGAALLLLTIIGFGASAVADRPAFAAWTLAAAVAYTAAAARHPNSRRLPLLVLAAGGTGLLILAALYAGDLREGLAAYLPAGSALVSTLFLSHDPPVPGAPRDIPGTLGGLS